MITEGIVLRAWPSREADLVLTIFTRELGKIAVVAKHARNSRRRFPGGFDPFDQGIFQLKTGRGLAYLESFQRMPTLRNIRRNLDKMTAASVLNEGFDVLIHEDAKVETSLFDLLDLGLKSIDQAETLAEILRALHVSLSSLLKICGFLDDTFAQAPSANNLIKLIDHLQKCGERQILSRSALEVVIEELRRDKKVANS